MTKPGGCARKGVFGAVGALMLVLNWAFSGVVIWITLQIRFWAIPLFFALGMALVALVLMILLPPPGVDWTKRLSPRLRDTLAFIRKMATPDDARFSTGTFWPRVRKYGSFWFILAATAVAAPLVGAFVARYLKLPERQAWTYTSASTLLMVVAGTALYLGAVEPLIDLVRGLV